MKRMLALATLLLLTSLFGEARADSYKIVAIPGFRAVSMNDHGDVAGTTPDEGAVYKNGVLHKIGQFTPRSINNAGQVAGNNGDAVAIYQNGVIREIYKDDFGLSEAYGINNAGEVVGIALRQSDEFPEARGFLYRDGTITPIATSKEWEISSATAISDSGAIAGYYASLNEDFYPTAFVYYQGTYYEIYGNSQWSNYSYGSAVNNFGQTTGFAPFDVGTEDLYESHAFLYTPESGLLLDLGTLGGGHSFGSGINDRGQVVGFSGLRSPGSEHAFLYQSGEMLNLNDFLPRNSGWVLQSAVDINNRGQIIGRGLYHGRPSAFLMTPDAGPQPVPEPATLLLLGTGLAAIGGVIRRRRQTKVE